MTDMLSRQLTILPASQSGTAVHVAEAIKDRLDALGSFAVTLIDEGVVPDVTFPGTDILLLVIATHGEGEVPDPFLPTFRAIEERQPDLRQLRYGVVALGDSTYHQTFCGAGRQVDTCLTALGAQRVGTRCEIDASSQPFPDEDALAWLDRWVMAL